VALDDLLTKLSSVGERPSSFLWGLLASPFTSSPIREVLSTPRFPHRRQLIGLVLMLCGHISILS